MCRGRGRARGRQLGEELSELSLERTRAIGGSLRDITPVYNMFSSSWGLVQFS